MLRSIAHVSFSLWPYETLLSARWFLIQVIPRLERFTSQVAKHER
jgi:hypothetical protein